MTSAPAHPAAEGAAGPALDTVTFTVGQSVPWPAAPGGVAQVAEVMRANVRIHYPTKNGRPRFRILSARKLAEVCSREPLLFEQFNPFQRGVLERRPKRRT